MKIYFSSKDLKRPPKNAVVAIGNFDGIHLGHKAILKRILTQKEKHHGTAVVYTFHPHPSHVLNPYHATPQLNSIEERLVLLQNMGIDITITEKFNKKFSQKSAYDFFYENLYRHIKPMALYVGYNFNFGKDREGNIELLKKLCKEVHLELHIAPPFKIKNEIVSSSKIRKLIQEGNVKKASSFLGRPFFIYGHVVPGEGRGQNMGIPTANLKTESSLIPKEGIYITMVELNGKLYPSATSVGNAPTFSEFTPFTIETHILDFNQRIYGQNLILYFIDRIRDIKKFASIDDLVIQIHRDIEKVRKFCHSF